MRLTSIVPMMPRLASKDSNLDVPRAEMALKRSLARLGAAD